jgi:hypothetical protein
MIAPVAPAPPADAATGTGGGPDRHADGPALPRLFDPDQPTHRATDPDTSRDFGRGDPSRNPGCARALLALAHLGAHGGCCSEIVHTIRTRWGTSSERAVVSRRIKDLRDLGYVSEDGSTRTPPETRRRQAVHFITPAGLLEVPGAERLVAS